MTRFRAWFTATLTRLSTLRLRMVCYVLLLSVPALLLIFVIAREQRATSTEAARENAMRLAELAASHQSQQIEAAHQLLVALSSLERVAGATPAECAVFLAALAEEYAQYVGFAALNLDGTVRCSSQPVPDSWNLMGDAFFQRTLLTGALGVGDYQFVPIVDAPVVGLAYPIREAGGEITGVIALGIQLEELGQWMARLELPPDSVVVVSDVRGHTVTSSPEGFMPLGSPINRDLNPCFQPETPPCPSGVAESVGPDGVRRYYGYTTLEGYPGTFYVSVGLSHDVALADLIDMQNHTLIAVLLTGLGVFAIGALAGYWMIVQPVNHLMGATEHLANGDLEARTNLRYSLRELDRLAFAINQLAASLQLREDSHKEAQQQLETEIAQRKQAQESMLDTLRTLSEEVEAKERAQAADRLKIRFLAMVSHELRTPLTGIKGFVTTLLAKDVSWDAASQEEFLHIINNETDRLMDMVEQLLDLSQIEAGSLRIKREPSDLCDLIRATEKRLKAVTPDHTLLLALPEALPPVVVDRGRISQVLVNLTSNAAKYSQPGTQITLSAAAEIDHLRVDVLDEGLGVPEGERERIFEAFNRISDRAQTVAGAGLGLAICRGIVEAHGGKIWVTDRPGQGRGGGAMFCFTLPLNDPDMIAVHGNGAAQPGATPPPHHGDA